MSAAIEKVLTLAISAFISLAAITAFAGDIMPMILELIQRTRSDAEFPLWSPGQVQEAVDGVCTWSTQSSSPAT